MPLLLKECPQGPGTVEISPPDSRFLPIANQAQIRRQPTLIELESCLSGKRIANAPAQIQLRLSA
jgi:hypothetical protein